MNFDPLPSQCLADQSLEIRLRGAIPDEPVVLRLCSRFMDGIVLSEATFRADELGLVDLTRDAPTSGSYDGVDPMGLFWSRAPVTGERAASLQALLDDPMTAVLVAESADGSRSTSHRIRRVFEGPEVTSRPVNEQGLVGVLLQPPGPGPHPAVLVVGGSGGGLGGSQQRASLLASHGFSALALAYFASEGLPAALDRIPLEYFGTALQWLAVQPGVAADRLGVMGSSRGGELALLLGAHFPTIRAVVAYVPSGIVWPAYPATGHSAWTLGGEEIPFAETMTLEEWGKALAEGKVSEDSFDWSLVPLRDPEYAQRASIPVERINGPVLMISGTDDKLWPSFELSEFAVRRLREHRFPHRFEHLCYAGAGHNIAWPHGPTTMPRSVHPVSGVAIDMGGTPRGDAHARLDSWWRMLAFLGSALNDAQARRERAPTDTKE